MDSKYVFRIVLCISREERRLVVNFKYLFRVLQKFIYLHLTRRSADCSFLKL